MAIFKDVKEVKEVQQPKIKSVIKPLEPSFPFRLIVKNAFNDYRRGHVIYSATEIQDVIDGNLLRHCNKIKV